MNFALISVRSNSTRLPLKCMLELRGLTVLQHVIRRVKYFGFEPVVVTSTNPSDDIIFKVANKEKVLIFRGSEKDKLDRWYRACIKYNIDKFITADCDDPFFCGNLMEKSFNKLKNKNNLVLLPSIQPNGGYYEGCVGYSIKTELIEKVCKEKKENDTEHAWQFLNSSPHANIDHFKVEKNIDIPPIRLTIDYPEDYILVREICEQLSFNSTRIEVLNLLEKNPELIKYNWFRNDDYLSRH